MDQSQHTHPKLSIITVCFNDKEGLLRTLESLRQQDFSDYEHILIDGGSTDGSKEIIEQWAKESTYVSYWCSETDGGVYFGMNKGLDQITGEYVYFLNAGDCLFPNILGQIPFDGTQFIYGRHTFTKNASEAYTPLKMDMITLMRDNPHHQASFMHHSLFDNIRFNTDYRIIADWIHIYDSLVFNRCTYRYIPIYIAIFDRGGISSDYVAAVEERQRYLQSLPPMLSEPLIDLFNLHVSGLRPLLIPFCRTRRWKPIFLRIIKWMCHFANTAYRVLEGRGPLRGRSYATIWINKKEHQQ